MYLVTVLAEELQCFLAEVLRPEGLSIGKTIYKNELGGDWTGFYDFLRTSSGIVIGIRYFPIEEMPPLTQAVERKPYIRVLPNGAIELYFSADRSFAPTLSGDQDYGENMLLRSPSGQFAITSGLSALNQSELMQLRQLARA